MMETDAPPVANVRQAASSRLQLVVEHDAIDATQFEVLQMLEAVENRSVSAQDEDESDSGAAAPPEVIRRQTPAAARS